MKRGFDADLVVWDRHPLQLGARPLKVIMDGETVINASKKIWKNSVKTLSSTQLPSHRVQHPREPNCTAGHRNFVITGLRRNFLTADQTDSSDPGNITLVVRSGHIQCVGKSLCDRAASRATGEGADVIHIPQGYLLPVCHYPDQFHLQMGVMQVNR